MYDGVLCGIEMDDVSQYGTLRIEDDLVKELAEKLKNKENIFMIGRGFQHATALEAALKTKEVSVPRIYGEGTSKMNEMNEIIGPNVIDRLDLYITSIYQALNDVGLTNLANSLR